MKLIKTLLNVSVYYVILRFFIWLILFFNTSLSESINYNYSSNLKWYFEGEQLHVETNQFINEEVLLYDVCGKLVHTYQITEDILQVNLSNLEKGAYFLKFKDETLKFVW